MIISNFVPKPVQASTLANGFKVLSYPDNSNPIVCIQLYIKTGSVREQTAQQGYAHFLEHLVFKNTKKYPDNQITYLAPKLGAMMNAYTDFDTTCYYLLLPSEELDTGLEILAEMAMNAKFTQADILVEKDIILEEIRQYRADPEASFIEYIQSTYFLKNPMKNPVLGTDATLLRATLRKLRNFYRKYYRPDNAFLVVAGDIDPKSIQGRISDLFSGWEIKPVKDQQTPPPYPEKIAFRSFSRVDSGQELVAVALPELDEKHPDSEALHIAIRYFAIGKASLLYKTLVEELKLCSNIKVSSLSGLNPGVSVIMMYPLQKRFIPKILERFMSLFNEMFIEDLDRDAMDMVKVCILHSWMFSFEGVENLANLVATEEFNGDLGRISTYGKYIESISAKQVSAALRRHWQWDYLAIYHQGKSISKVILEFMPKAIPPHSDIEIESTCPERELTSPAGVSKASETVSTLQAYHKFSLLSGMNVIYHYQPNKPICGFALSSPLSQLCEPQPGINYFTSAMMLYATQNRTHEGIIQLTREHGFNIRLIHHLDSTTFRGKCHQSDLFTALELLSDILKQPRFEKSYLGLLKHAALDSLRREKDYPPAYAYRRWFERLYGKDNNLFYSTGLVPDIKNISIDDIEGWYHEWQLARDFTLCVTGSIAPDHFFELAEKLFGGKPPSADPKIQTPRFEPTTPSVTIQRKGLDQAIIHIGGHACPAQNHLENAAFHVLAQILGGDLSSRMFYILREKYGYAYQCGFEFSSIKNLGYWYAYALCDAKSYRDCLRLMQEILCDVTENGVHADELDSAKKYLIGMSRFDHESVSFRASSIANLIALGYDLEFYLSREQRIRDVSAELIHDLAAKWLSERYVHVVV